MPSEAREEKSNPADDSEIFLPSHNNTTDVDANPNAEGQSASEKPVHLKHQSKTSRVQVASQKGASELIKASHTKTRSKYNNSMFYLP